MLNMHLLQDLDIFSKRKGEKIYISAGTKAKAAEEWLQKKSVNIIQWPSQSAKCNPTENLWHSLKIAVTATSGQPEGPGASLL